MKHDRIMEECRRSVGNRRTDKKADLCMGLHFCQGLWQWKPFTTELCKLGIGDDIYQIMVRIWG